MTQERAGMFKLAERLQIPVGALLSQMTGAEVISWGMLGEWEHQQKQLAEFKKAQAYSHG